MIGMRAHDLEYDDIQVLSEKLKEYDMKRIQLALMKSVKDVQQAGGVYDENIANKIKTALDKNGVKVTVLGCYINPVCPDTELRKKEMEKFRENIKYARAIGADMIGTETGSVSPDGLFHLYNHSEENYQDFLSVMKELVAYAHELGVTVGVEAVTIFTIHSPETMKRFLDDIGFDNVKVIFDPMNYLDISNYKNQREIYEKAFRLYGDRIGVIHCKDFVVEGDALKYVLPTYGGLDYDYLSELANEYCPDAPWLLEEVKEKDVAEISGKIQKIKRA